MARSASPPLSSASSTSSSSSPRAQRPVRKSTAVARREEKIALLHELEVLRAYVRLHRQRQGRGVAPVVAKTESHESDDDPFAKDSTSVRLRQAIFNRHVQVARLRGMLCAQTTTQQFEPLHARLCLSGSHVERRETLRRIHADKIRDAEAFMLARCATMDLTVPYSSHEKFQDPISGDLESVYFDITQFPGIASVHRVYDALRFWSSNLEICVSERLGTITIREDMEEDDCTEPTSFGEAFSSVRRIRSTLDSGVSAGGAQAAFGQVFDVGQHNERVVMTVQPVASDVLHATHGDVDVHIEATCVMYVTTLGDNSGTVVMSRWAQMRVRPNRARDVAMPQLHAVLNTGVGRWFEIFHRVMWEQLYTTESASQALA